MDTQKLMPCFCFAYFVLSKHLYIEEKMLVLVEIREHHRLGGLNSNHLFLEILEYEILQIQCLVRTLLWVTHFKSCIVFSPQV